MNQQRAKPSNPTAGQSPLEMLTIKKTCIAAGYDNGDLKIFDLKTNCLRWDTNLKNGICGLEFDRPDINMNKLVATTLESKFHVFDLKTYHPSSGYTSLDEMAHKSTIWGVKHLP